MQVKPASDYLSYLQADGDPFLSDVAIHVTTAPGETVIGRCRDNIDNGHRPIIVTTARGLTVAEGLAESSP